jgi:hypothetical protein
MFHVERKKKSILIKRKTIVVFLFCVFASCGVNKSRITISDFYIHENGKKLINTKPLNAFVFENDLANNPFQEYVSNTYKTITIQNTELWVTIDKSKFKLIFYDFDEFEKYFGSQNFTATNQETLSQKTGNNNKFIAVSVISDKNEDCLNTNSLYYTQTIEYLKKLKNNYFIKNGRL